MNYNELPDDEIDMLIATRAAGWQLSEESAYSLEGGLWARMTWDDGRERWLPHYTQSFDDAIAAAQHMLNTNEGAIEPFVNGLSLTYKAAIGRFIVEATPRALCILMLEALDAAATGLNADGEPFRICTQCEPNHIENCRTCFGFGLALNQSPLSASVDPDCPHIPCPECGSTPAGYQPETLPHAPTPHHS